MSDGHSANPNLISGPLLATGLGVSAVVALGAACLGWVGVPILIALLAIGAAQLLRWSR